MIPDFCAAPPLYESEVIAKLRAEIAITDYLFYRTGVDEFDEFLGLDAPVWEMQCTACGGRWLADKNRKNPPKSMTQCPACGAAVRPRKWRDRAILDKDELTFHIFQPDGERMWLRGYMIGRSRDGTFWTFEYQRVVYTPGGAARWTRGYNDLHGTGEWKRRKGVRLARWNKCYTQVENWFGALDWDDIRGTCIAYSQLDRALTEGVGDIVEYLALYVRYPAVEFLWKLGFGWALRRREGEKAAFRRCFNLRAKTPQGMLKGLNKADVRLLGGQDIGFAALEAYTALRRAGTIGADADGLAYAQGAADAREIIKEQILARPELYPYFRRQAGRSGIKYGDLMRDWGDYLRELDEAGGGEELPDNLREAHERLSMRLLSLRRATKNAAFRARRHLLRRYCWRWGGLLIRPIDSENEIIREGELQRNCVARYAGEHARGETAIFVLRERSAPDKPYCTVEYLPEKNRVVQCRSYHNGSAPPAASEFMKRWTERNEKFERNYAKH